MIQQRCNHNVISEQDYEPAAPEVEEVMEPICVSRAVDKTVAYCIHQKHDGSYVAWAVQRHRCVTGRILAKGTALREETEHLHQHQYRRNFQEVMVRRERCGPSKRHVVHKYDKNRDIDR